MLVPSFVGGKQRRWGPGRRARGVATPAGPLLEHHLTLGLPLPGCTANFEPQVVAAWGHVDLEIVSLAYGNRLSCRLERARRGWQRGTVLGHWRPRNRSLRALK